MPETNEKLTRTIYQVQEHNGEGWRLVRALDNPTPDYEKAAELLKVANLTRNRRHRLVRQTTITETMPS